MFHTQLYILIGNRIAKRQPKPYPDWNNYIIKTISNSFADVNFGNKQVVFSRLGYSSARNQHTAPLLTVTFPVSHRSHNVITLFLA